MASQFPSRSLPLTTYRWANFWNLLLSRQARLETEIVAHKRVLELGSGVGFLGALIATLQIQQLAASSRDLHPGSLYLTDINDEVLTRCQNNIRLDCSGCEVKHFSQSRSKQMRQTCHRPTLIFTSEPWIGAFRSIVSNGMFWFHS